MRQTVVLVLVGAVIFVGSYFLFTEETPFKLGPLDLDSPKHRPEAPVDGEVVPIRPRGANAGENPATAPDPSRLGETALLEEPIDDAAFGALGGQVTGADGAIPAVIGVALAPPAGTQTRAEGGVFEVTNLPPGVYQLRLWADGYVAHTLYSLQVNAGRKRILDVRLTPGVRPRGRVVDDTDQLPVSGVTVDFGGGLRMLTDAGGRFTAPFTVLPEATREVTLSHPGFDRVTFRDLPAQDPEDMRLAVTRGKSAISLMLINTSEREWPPAARARLFLVTGGQRRTLKREIRLDPRVRSEISGVLHGRYFLIVDFPGAAFPQREKEILVHRERTLDVEMTFDQGVEVRGRLVARAAGVQARKVELIDLQGHVVATATSDREGRFVLVGVPSGHYRVKVWIGMPCFNTEEVVVERRKVFEITVDCDRRRLVWK